LQVNGNEFEGNVHFFSDFDGLLEREIEGVNGLYKFFFIIEQFSLGEECVSYLSLAKVFLCVFDF
jgi:hypothetical protein